MKDYGLAALLFLGLSSFFIVAWVGMIVGRDDRPWGRFVKRHHRAIVISLASVHFALFFFDRPEITHRADSVILFIGAFIFVPLLGCMNLKKKSQ